MKRLLFFSGLALVLFLTLIAIEAFQSESWSEFALDIFEKALLVIAIVTVSYVSVQMRDLQIEHTALAGDLSRARAEGDRWRETARVHIDGLGRAIQNQFDNWKLTASEADVALLMLKGFSHKEIARLRNSSEATVRQQAASVYGKSGLASRAELAGFFLEDLFVQGAGRESEPSTPTGDARGARRVSHML